MTVTQIIGEIVALPALERAEVIRCACSLEAEGMLSGAALTTWGERLAATRDVAEAQVLRDSIETGFYGRR
jgi:hypothetical protein